MNTHRPASSFSRGLAAAALMALAALPAQAITVNANTDADALANAILGSGISIVPGSATLVNAGGVDFPSAGLFSDGGPAGSNIGIESGILLTTGDVSFADGASNDGDGLGSSFGSNGNAELDALAAPGVTMDATVLTFDFTTDSGSLFFNFLFASEEYSASVGTEFNDILGIFVDGTNIALVPGTTSPISINTVNAVTNSAFYNDNDMNGAFPFQFDGFTSVLTASVTGLSAGQHTITLAIADVTDSGIDSAVFIQANSLTSGAPASVPEGANSLGLGLIACLGLAGFKRLVRRG